MSDKQAVFYHPRDRHLSARGSTPLTRAVIASCLRELGIGSGDVVMGAVVSFQVRCDFLERYDIHTVGSAIRQES